MTLPTIAELEKLLNEKDDGQVEISPSRRVRSTVGCTTSSLTSIRIAIESSPEFMGG
jgi:hypothetical protein